MAGLTALEEFTVWAHQQLNPDRSKFLNVSDEVTPFAASNGCWDHVDAQTPQNSLSMVHTTNKDLFESGKRGKYRLTPKGHNLAIDIDTVRLARAKSIRRRVRDSFNKIVKLVFKEGNRTTVTGQRIARNSGVRKAAIAHHGEVCSVCDRHPNELGFSTSFLEAHHLDELKTYEEKNIGETNIVDQIAVVCTGCHRTHIHPNGHKSCVSIEDARKSFQSFLVSV